MSLSACKMWWPGTELNRRRQPFQGCALPPELPGHISKPASVAGCEDSSASRLMGADCRPNQTDPMQGAFGTHSIIATARDSLNVDRHFAQSKLGHGSHRTLMNLFSRIFSASSANKYPQNPRRAFYAAKLFTNSIKLRNAIPDGPFAIHGF